MILTIVLIIISASGFSVMWTLQFRFGRSRFKNLNPRYWNPAISEWNKYISPSDQRPKFFGSTTIFVASTDAFHLFQFIGLNSLILAGAINITWYSWYINFIIIRSIYGLVWWVLFEHVLVKK